MINPVMSFDSVQQQAEQILQSMDQPSIKEKAKKPKSLLAVSLVYGGNNELPQRFA